MKQTDYDNSIADFQGACNCIALTDPNDEGHFSWSGCDIDHTDSELGNTVFGVQGYNPETKEIEELGEICADCLCYIYNGDAPAFIDEQ